MTDLEAVRQACATVRREAVEIYELCQLAGRMDLAAAFVLDGTPPHQVRRALESLAPTQPVKRPSAGNGVAFDWALIERELAEKRRQH